MCVVDGMLWIGLFGSFARVGWGGVHSAGGGWMENWDFGVLRLVGRGKGVGN